MYDTQRAGRLLSAYVDDLSNWYVRRSRRRFWAGDPAALATLHECLYVVTLLLAPLTPFVTERVWQDLFASTTDELPDSVHLASWPEVDGSLIDASSPTRWRSYDGSSSSVGPRARRRASGRVSRWAVPSSPRPAGTGCPRSCVPRWPTSSTASSCSASVTLRASSSTSA